VNDIKKTEKIHFHELTNTFLLISLMLIGSFSMEEFPDHVHTTSK